MNFKSTALAKFLSYFTSMVFTLFLLISVTLFTIHIGSHTTAIFCAILAAVAAFYAILERNSLCGLKRITAALEKNQLNTISNNEKICGNWLIIG